MQYKIDLNRLSELKFEEAHAYEALQSFLNDLNSPNVFYGNEQKSDSYNQGPYNYAYKGNSYTFKFKQTIIRSDRKSGKLGHRFNYFERVNSPYPKGAYGAVYPILGSITFTSNDFIKKPGGKKVVKHEQFKKEGRKNSVIKEYNGLLKASHIKVNPPVFNKEHNDYNSFLIMEQVEGESLETLLNPNKRSRKLSLKERIEITFALLQAVQEQLVNRKLIHRDIKPSNVIVNLATSPPTVKIIDFGFNLNEGEQDNLKCGTRAFRSPESFDLAPSYTSKSDVWSTGRILSYLWGDNYKNYYLPKDKDRDFILNIVSNATLFSEPELEMYLTPEDKQKIEAIINSMTQVSHLTRASIEETIRLFKKIDFDKYTNSNSATFSKKEAGQQLEQIEQWLLLLDLKSGDLSRRNFYAEASELSRLKLKLAAYTNIIKNEFNPFLIKQYKQLCTKEIIHSRSVVHHHRNLNWLLAEITSAILLLGVGYVVALGINYFTTGRIGLFSQTKSENLLNDMNKSILKVGP